MLARASAIWCKLENAMKGVHDSIVNLNRHGFKASVWLAAAPKGSEGLLHLIVFTQYRDISFRYFVLPLQLI
jgi:hypothetical protein